MSTPEVELVTLVGVFDPSRLERMKGLGPSEIVSVEQRLGETITTSQAATPRGSGPRLAIPRRQLDMLFVPERLEVRSEAALFRSAVASKMVDFFDAVIAELGQLPWTRVGYNFILWTELESPVVDIVATKFFREDLGKALGAKAVVGGAAWVWLDINGDTLWLKLEPHRESLTTHRIIANANVTIELESQSEFPSSSTIQENLLKHLGQAESVLEALES